MSRKEKLDVCTYSDKRLFETSELQATVKDRLVSLCFASEIPVRRSYGWEILVCTPDTVSLERINAKASLLFNHDANEVIGVVEQAKIDTDRKARATVKISVNRSDILNDIRDKVLNLVSVGYETTRLIKVEEKDGDKYYYWAWSPYEVSIVSIPADYKHAGIGRAKENSDSIGSLKQAAVKAEITNRGQNKMTEDIKEIMSLAKANNAYELANEVIAEGKGINEFRALLLNKITKESAKKQDVANDMERTEKRTFSIRKAVLSLLKEPGVDAGFEREVSAEIARKSGRGANGLFIPGSAFVRAITTTTAATAIPTTVGDFIDVLSARTISGQLGVTFMSGLSNPVKLPKATDGQVYWVGEHVAPTASTFSNFDSVTLSPQVVGGYTDVSKLALLESSIGLEQYISNRLVNKIAVEMDRVMLNGTGSGEPRGLLNTSGINEVDLTDDAPTLSEILQFEKALLDNNVYAMSPRWALATDVYAKLAGTAAFQYGSNGLIDLGSNTLLGKPFVTNSLIPQGLAIYGDWQEAIIATFGGGIEITASDAMLQTTGGVRIVGLCPVAVGFTHPEAFAKGRVVSDESSSSGS